jgi:hypothetical protein
MDHYILGIFIIGLPLSATSAWFYRMGNRMDYHPMRWLMVLIRNIIHPEFIYQGPCPSQSNYQMTYEGLIGFFVESMGYQSKKETDIRLVIYIFIPSIFWPIRVTWITLVWFATFVIPAVIVYLAYMTVVSALNL